MFFSKKLSKFENLKHCFFSRKDGFSGGKYKSLNCGLGSQDNKENVLKSGLVKTEDGDKIVPYIDIDLPKSGITKNQLLMLDIIANNDNFEKMIEQLKDYVKNLKAATYRS